MVGCGGDPALFRSVLNHRGGYKKTGRQVKKTFPFLFFNSTAQNKKRNKALKNGNVLLYIVVLLKGTTHREEKAY
jgi:hypothetical protein